ncbi:RNA polymerase sigma factor ShbA [Actinophytocola oryzae]|uniref:RNA polymerase sigma-70 factor (ECF subfamily) n=1 Tax=Actinophytocola oryzae TaxID=502181 RepID=A0A4R7VN47_9PSEU|nr:RNA polymerase sigma factor ShbA [Actinophytocola oryzae]TDV50974.1 RNA polymerase sigma-70 factor (ECF subfamily) [Actinophytocola oryzae]
MLCTVEPEVDLAQLEAELATVVAAPTAVPAWSRPVTRSNLDVVAAAASAGDTAATDELLSYLRPIMVRFCRTKLGRVRPISSADDVAQEVCIAIFRALPTYQHLGRPFLSFVFGVAAHKVADVHRAAARDRSLPTAETPDTITLAENPEEIALRRELVEQTSDLLQTLLPRQREIVVMRVVLGMSAQETADAVGTTPDAVRVAQHRALNRLRRTITR